MPRKAASRGVCSRCGRPTLLVYGSWCEDCLGHVDVIEIPAKGTPQVRPEPLSPEEERLRELQLRRQLDEREPEENRCEGTMEKWFERQKGPGLCWHCHRNPGVDQLGGMCQGCNKGGEKVETTTKANGTERIEAIKAAADRVKNLKDPDRRKAIAELIQRHGPLTSHVQIRQAVDAAGLGHISNNLIDEIRYELWPPMRPKVETATPAEPVKVSMQSALDRKQRRERLKDILAGLGVATPEAAIQKAVAEAGLTSISGQLLTELRDELWPDRERGARNRKGSRLPAEATFAPFIPPVCAPVAVPAAICPPPPDRAAEPAGFDLEFVLSMERLRRQVVAAGGRMAFTVDVQQGDVRFSYSTGGAS